MKQKNVKHRFIHLFEVNLSMKFKDFIFLTKEKKKIESKIDKRILENNKL